MYSLRVVIGPLAVRLYVRALFCGAFAAAKKFFIQKAYCPFSSFVFLIKETGIYLTLLTVLQSS